MSNSSRDLPLPPIDLVTACRFRIRDEMKSETGRIRLVYAPGADYACHRYGYWTPGGVEGAKKILVASLKSPFGHKFTFEPLTSLGFPKWFPQRDDDSDLPPEDARLIDHRCASKRPSYIRAKKRSKSCAGTST